MINIRSLDELKNNNIVKPVILTTGMFDGLHRAHRELIRRTVQTAREQQGTAIVFTFRNHPLSILAPSYAPRSLMSPERKAWMLEQMGIDILVQMEFSESFASITADEFVRNILIERFMLDKIIVGYDFRFGNLGHGTVENMQALGAELGFAVETLAAIYHEEWTISSTRIRELLVEGRVHQAACLLGRPFDLTGSVRKGHGRGKELGFPTANLELKPQYVTPASGVYAALVQLDGKIHNGMLNIGSSPTFSGTEYRLEVFLIDYDGENFYDQDLRVYFVQRIREERKFPSSQALRERLKIDQQVVTEILQTYPLRNDPDHLRQYHPGQYF